MKSIHPAWLKREVLARLQRSILKLGPSRLLNMDGLYISNGVTVVDRDG